MQDHFDKYAKFTACLAATSMISMEIGAHGVCARLFGDVVCEMPSHVETVPGQEHAPLGSLRMPVAFNTSATPFHAGTTSVIG